MSACVAPSGLSADASPPQIVNNTAVEYANTAPSTDTILRPTPFGVQDFTQIRDASAPETMTYQVALQPGQYLQQLDSGSVAIVDPTVPTISGSLPPGGSGAGTTQDPNVFSEPRSTAGDTGQIDYTPQDLPGLTPEDSQILPAQSQFQYDSENRLLNYADQDVDGQEVAILTPPYAHDAAGVDVPTSMTITGPNTVATTTAHKEGAYTYPVMSEHHTTATKENRKHKFAFGFSEGTLTGIQAANSQGEGVTKIRAVRHIPSRTTGSLQQPPTARYVQYYQDSCDHWDTPGPNCQDIESVPRPPLDSAGHETPLGAAWRQCKAGADFIHTALAEQHLTPYITLQPDPNTSQTPAQYAPVSRTPVDLQLLRASQVLGTDE